MSVLHVLVMLVHTASKCVYLLTFRDDPGLQGEIWFRGAHTRTLVDSDDIDTVLVKARI
jgi:hypothetical protein